MTISLTRLLQPQWIRVTLLFALAFVTTARVASAQGATTGMITGVVLDAQKRPVAGASVVAIHLPSGTPYETVTREDGRFIIPNMRVGGPYSVVVADRRRGRPRLPGTDAGQRHGQPRQCHGPELRRAADRSKKTSRCRRRPTRCSTRSARARPRPSRASSSRRCRRFGGRLNDITRLTPQSGGTLSFAGADSRLNNITVDGSYFNNSFGLRNSPGDTSGVAPISLAAIEQVQVNIAPYDVRQGNFVGAEVNTVTRSGGNTWHGVVLRLSSATTASSARSRAARRSIPARSISATRALWGSGPDRQEQAVLLRQLRKRSVRPARHDVPRQCSAAKRSAAASRACWRIGPRSAERVPEDQLQLRHGPVPGLRQHDAGEAVSCVKSDYNLNDHNKLVLRYNQLDSYTDNLVSNSTSLGFGNRRTSTRTA